MMKLEFGHKFHPETKRPLNLSQDQIASWIGRKSQEPKKASEMAKQKKTEDSDFGRKRAAPIAAAAGVGAKKRVKKTAATGLGVSSSSESEDSEESEGGTSDEDGYY